jgi:CheY-like chemotaxis protein
MAESNGKTVLVVEDEPMTLDLTVSFLSGAGYNVVSATTFKEAVEALEEEPIDFLLTDTQYKLNGNGRIDDRAGVKLSNHVAGKIPVIATSGAYEPEIKALYAKEGQVDIFIPKPINFPSLLVTCDKLLKEHDITHSFPFTEEQLTEFRSAGQMGTVCELYRIGKDYFSAHSDDKGKYTGDLDFAIGLNHLHSYILENRPKD